MAEPSDEDLGVEGFQWDSKNPGDSVQRLYEKDTSFARSKMRWYFAAGEEDGRYARWLRLPVIILLTLGALCPLIDATGLWETKLTPWGYVLFALAAGVFGVDRLYGYSTGWTRNTATWLGIRRVLVAFEHDWVIATGGENRDWRKEVKLLKDFREALEAAVVAETAVWSAEQETARKAIQANIDRGSGG